MKLLVLSASDIHQLLGYGQCADAMRTALGALASGQASQPLRSIVRFPAATGLMGLMPARLAAGAPPAGEAAGSVDSAAYGLKAICITPGNPALGLDTHQGIVLLSEGQTGEPLAVLNASAITEIRTAAVSVLATDVLARRGAGDLAVVGTGVQARAHVLAFARTRPLRRVRVAGRTPNRAEALAAALQPEMPTKIIVSPSVRDAVAGADIIVTATSSAEPVLRRDWIAAGAHINAVGACLPAARELDSAIIADAALFADSRESLLAESGDYLLAVADGLAGPGSIRAELGDVLSGQAPGRGSDQEITVFESLGLAVEDLAAGLAVYRAAAGGAAGRWVEF
ncbi:MAG TPA: ornithine cyclodeaminase family protein [Streptosporangiaceae bacterium]|jgi:ornithine cyclodeaminase/alanine dehydrogenase-like protein (mu-crystallin family)